MSFSLPGTQRYYLPRDDLDPEKFELIISPLLAWPRIDSEDVFDDRWSSSYPLINMRRREFNYYINQLPPNGPREREKLKRLMYDGEVVLLESFSSSPGWLFYINKHGELICRDPLALKFNGAQKMDLTWCKHYYLP